jgi:hypothetical protein
MVGEMGKFAMLLSGEKLYQQRAREALPLLVRQAQIRRETVYEDLAHQLGMPNPRNLNYVLGYIGEALQSLSAEWDEDIPPIQCLVVNKRTGLPGEGIWWFITSEEDFHSFSRERQRALLRAELQRVYEYSRWPAVLDALDLLARPDSNIIDEASELRGGGESEQHQRLKKYIAEHPEVLQLPATARADTEFHLPSGDSLDVLFRVGDDWTAVEVKSAKSLLPDIVRGMFQCVKYQAVIKALQATQGRTQSARAILAIEGAFPAQLESWKQVLGSEVIDLIRAE